MIDFHIPETVNAWVLGNPDELAPVAKRVRRPVRQKHRTHSDERSLPFFGFAAMVRASGGCIDDTKESRCIIDPRPYVSFEGSTDWTAIRSGPRCMVASKSS